MRKTGIAAALSLLIAPPLTAQTREEAPQPPARYGPQPPAPAGQAAGLRSYIVSADEPRPAPAASGPQVLIGSRAPDGRMMVGLGLFRVQRMDRNDPNRASPMRDSRGRTQRVAAVGLSLNF